MPREKNRTWRILAASIAAGSLIALSAVSAQAYAPTPGVMYQLPDSQSCLKGRGNCVVYPKTAQLGNGRLVASFELATVPASGTAVGETLPIYKSDDDGTTWQKLTDVKAPAYMSSNPAVQKYTSAWTNPYLYVMPQSVGNLAAGTLIMGALVTGEDEFYKERKAADPNFVPFRDGERRDTALALYSSTDGGANWTFQNVITTGGWSNNQVDSQANSSNQQDPVWEPYFLVYNNQLVAYYSDENEYLSMDPVTGTPKIDPANETAGDTGGQILAHRTWDGLSSSWSTPVVDASGATINAGGGKQLLGGFRPGMSQVVPTTDGKWMLTFEYFEGGLHNRYKISDSPLTFFKAGPQEGTPVTTLPRTAGSGALSSGGNPVMIRLPDGRLAYNSGGNGNIWVNASGNSTGSWTEFQTTMPDAYSRNLTYNVRTGRINILASAGNPGRILFADIDLGKSAGAYYRIVNRATGQVIGSNNNTTDANIGNRNSPDVRLEVAGSASNADTQLWHIINKPGGGVALLSKAGGRSASVWTGNASSGQRIGQWVDDSTSGPFRLFTKTNGDVYFQSTANPDLYLTGSSVGGILTLQPSDGGSGSQDWQLIAQ